MFLVMTLSRPLLMTNDSLQTNAVLIVLLAPVDLKVLRAFKDLKGSQVLRGHRVLLDRRVYPVLQVLLGPQGLKVFPGHRVYLVL
jgi:hypothetical protein